MSNDSGKGAVLIVDDESEIREILSIHVESYGFQVFEAEDGERALEVMRDNDIDVVLSDIMMPRMSGMVLLRSLRDEGFEAPFIFLTAYASKEATVEALRLGAFDFLEKPFESEDIQRLIKEAMRVALERKKILHGSAVHKQVGESEKQILALRSLRFQNEPSSAAVISKDKANIRLIEMFVEEALPQLVFCEASVKGLVDHDTRAWELAYLFRVMQGLKEASSSIGLTRIEKFTDILENCFTVFRVKPGDMTDEQIQLMGRSVSAAQELVSMIGSEENLSSATTQAEEDIAVLLQHISL